jgi:hypothetical protein
LSAFGLVLLLPLTQVLKSLEEQRAVLGTVELVVEEALFKALVVDEVAAGQPAKKEHLSGGAQLALEV